MHPDVLVVGFGPAGASVAAAAAAAGCNVLAVERRAVIGAPVQCAEFVSSVLSIDALSWASVGSVPIERMVTVVEGEPAEVTDDFRGRMISRLLFDQALARRAIARGARCITGTGVTRVLADGTVRLSDGREMRPRVLVGADGPRSRIGAAIMSANREFVATRQVTVRLTQPHDATDIFLRAAYRGGYAWLFPRGPVANVGIGVDYAGRECLKPLLSDLVAELVAAGRIAPRAAERLTGGLIPVGGRLRAIGRLGRVPVLLAGDAAGLTNPVTGAGIDVAVCSGQLAGAAVAKWLAGDSAAIDDYEDELAALYDPAYARALRRRRDLLSCGAGGRPSVAMLRRAWISAPEYWSESRTPNPSASAPEWTGSQSCAPSARA